MVSTGDTIDGRPGDTALVSRILEDPSRGWAAAWDLYGHPLHSFCLRMLDDPAEAEDAVADVFLVAAQQIDRLQRPEALRAWLYAIARRRVQRRWRDRARTAPVDPHGDLVMNTSTGEIEVSGADDAAELLAAASAGLGDRDRELLALTLGADLDTTEVARITGESTNAVSVRVTRLKETVARAAGALLVARHHRRACEILDGILTDWDGTFDTVWRKRIARHIDTCEECTDRRGAATAVFAAPLLLPAPSRALRDRVLQHSGVKTADVPDDLAATTADGTETFDVATAPVPDLGPYDDDGFPTNRPGRGRPAWWLVAAGVVAMALLTTGVLVWAGSRDSAPDQALATTSPDDTVPATITTTTTTTAEPPSASLNEPIGEGDVAAPPTPGAGAPSTSLPGLAEPTPTSTPAPPPTPLPAPSPTTITTSPPTTSPAPPTVTMSLTPTHVQDRCEGEQVIVTVHVTAAVGPASTKITWDGPNPGTTNRSGTGTKTVTLGPFDPGSFVTVTVTAVTTDGLGRTSSPATRTFTVDPCPG